MDEEIEKINIELFLNIPIGGLGSKESIRKAFSYLKDLPAIPNILDIGCFTGLKTIELAKLSKGQIIAIDIIQAYIDKLKENAKASGVADQIEALNKSMSSMDFDDGTFDVIWCDMAIFFFGFEKGLKEWRRFLKKGGYMVLSELVWLKDNPPDEVKKHWEDEYPLMKKNEENIVIIKNLQYKLIDSFILKEEDCWNCYTLSEKSIVELREKFATNPKILEFLEINQREIDIFRKYSEYYGFAFYIMQN